jgi:NTE family protein
MVEAFNIVQDRISRSRLAGDPPDMIIQPRMPDCGLFDFHRAEEFIQAGAKAVRRDLDDIKREIAARCSPPALLARSA